MLFMTPLFLEVFMDIVNLQPEPVKIEKPTIQNLFPLMKSAIALDIAPLHTGIVIWNGETTEEYGFANPPVDYNDVFWEYRLRKTFKAKVQEIVNGRQFEYGVVEDVYGGDNFHTVRQLLALNNVFDELQFDRACFVDNYFRWGASEWMAKARKIYKQKNKLVSKIETQGLLEFLEYKFYLEHKEDTTNVKKEIFFEDICDACGMLVGVVAHKTLEKNLLNNTSVRLSDIKMYYLEDLEETYGHRDTRLREEAYTTVELNYRSLEGSIINSVKENPDDVLVAYLPVAKLGTFGLTHKFKFYASGEGYLVFYRKGKK